VDEDREHSPWTGWANAETYDSFVREHPIYRWLNRQLVEIGRVAEAGNVLDLACGTGATTRACLAVLPPRGEILGVDASTAMVEVARARVGDPRARFAVAPASGVSQVAASAAPFDRVLSNAAFWQFPDPASVLAGLSPLLTPGALFAFNVPASRLAGEATPVHPFQVALARAVSDRSGAGAGGGSEAVDPGVLEAALREAGFRLVSRERRVYRSTQHELMELMEIPAMLHRAAPGLAPARRRDALVEARRATDPEQAVEVPWLYWLASFGESPGQPADPR